MTRDDAIESLREAFHGRNITLYLGAGVSIGSGLPSWDQLVLGMYFNKISHEYMEGWRPFSNYLFAISEWYLKTKGEPLEITARKLQKFYETHDRSAFLEDLYATLYENFQIEGVPRIEIDSGFVRANNPTLAAVASLCQSPAGGVGSVVTYNYDNLMEMALAGTPCDSIFRAEQAAAGGLPIYHVHGFVPFRRGVEHSTGDEIVFTEEEYHRVAESPFYWSNLIQLQLLSSTTGLMVGLSLSDRNMRRILDAIDNSPIKSRNFALLPRPDRDPPDDATITDIHEKAKSYLSRFENSGIKRDDWYGERAGREYGSAPRAGIKGAPRYLAEIEQIVQQVKRIDEEQQEYVLGQLGITPIWMDSFNEIPAIISEIIQ
jgi:hypothetical protein